MLKVMGLIGTPEQRHLLDSSSPPLQFRGGSQLRRLAQLATFLLRVLQRNQSL
jgi:hypothetical protein